MQNLLDVLGIRKNEYEINSSLKKLKGEKPKQFKVDDEFTKENFLDIVESFHEFRVEDKFLVEAFRKIDTEENGILNLMKIQEISNKLKLNFTEEEIKEILEYFTMETYLNNNNAGIKYQNFKSQFDFENFCKLYYQG